MSSLVFFVGWIGLASGLMWLAQLQEKLQKDITNLRQSISDLTQAVGMLDRRIGHLQNSLNDDLGNDPELFP